MHLEGNCTTQDTCACIVYIANGWNPQVDMGYTIGLQLRSQIYFHFIFEPAHDKTNKMACTPSEDISACAYTENTSKNISVTTGWISIKHDRIVPWEVLYQNCSNLILLRCTKWLPELKTEKKTSNDIFYIPTGRISTRLDRIVPWEVHYQNCSNHSAPLHKMAARAKNRINFKWHLCNHWEDFS